MRKALITLATAVAVAGSVVAVGGPAEAASSPIAACGGGSYHVIDTHDLSGYATIYLMYNGSTDCVVTWRTKDVGTARWTTAYVQKQGGDQIANNGYFQYYAGPVKVSAAGVCIKWGGTVNEGNGHVAVWNSDWSHCG
ncbi:hypothetical protein GCM10023191_079260 [Actinoallomurus oryzae]|jgi:hypothetical protein|uniref:Serine/threonine protein kinase n=1 Tax=Actinoallomurus oryzae TaxID=502180 RepID=A0ABP8QY37_9ACTN